MLSNFRKRVATTDKQTKIILPDKKATYITSENANWFIFVGS